MATVPANRDGHALMIAWQARRATVFFAVAMVFALSPLDPGILCRKEKRHESHALETDRREALSQQPQAQRCRRRRRRPVRGWKLSRTGPSHSRVKTAKRICFSPWLLGITMQRRIVQQRFGGEA